MSTEPKFTREDAWKENLLRLVSHHKANCSDGNCGVSLYLVREMAEKAGVKFTDKEKEKFL